MFACGMRFPTSGGCDSCGRGDSEVVLELDRRRRLIFASGRELKDERATVQGRPFKLIRQSFLQHAQRNDRILWIREPGELALRSVNSK